MLSDVDIKRRLGKNIAIFPFNGENIRGCSVYITASKLAWSLKTKKKISNHEKILIPADDAALIISTETISLDKNVAGICQSRVSLIKLGLGNSAAPIRPGYTGRLLIVINNRTDKEIAIDIDTHIANVMLHRLVSEANSSDNDAASLMNANALKVLGLDLSDEDCEELDSQGSFERDVVKNKMIHSQEYEEFKRNDREVPSWILFVMKHIIEIISVILGAVIGAVAVKGIG